MIAAAAMAPPQGPVPYPGYRIGEPAGDSIAASTPGEPRSQPAAGAGKDAPANRYNSLAFVYNQSASRLVMLVRSPATGETEAQVPTEAALRLYQATARENRRTVEPASGSETGLDTGPKTDAKTGRDGAANDAAGQGTGMTLSAGSHHAVDIVVAAEPTGRAANGGGSSADGISSPGISGPGISGVASSGVSLRAAASAGHVNMVV